MRTWQMTMGAALALGLVSAAWGEDPDCKDILTKVNNTTKALKGVNYKIETYGEGEEKDKQPRAKGTVWLKRLPGDAPLPLAKAEITVNPPGDKAAEEMTIIYDGKEVLQADKKTKKFKRMAMSGDAGPGAIGPMQLVMFAEYTHPKPFDDELAAESTKYEGKKAVGGVECHVIYVVYGSAGGDARWYFGINDNLPHRVDRINQHRVFEVTELKTDPAFDDKSFALVAPEGYEDDSPGLLAVGRNAPAFTLSTPDGKTVSLADLKGKVVVLDFWASWSTPCKNWMPIVQKTAEKFKDKDVAFFGVNAADNKDIDAAAFMKEKGCTYGVLVKGDEVSKQYRAEIPTTYVIGRDGKVAFSMKKFKADDPETEAKLVKAIEAALSAK